MSKDKRLRGVSFNSNESGNSQPTVHRKQLIINVLEAKGLTTGNPKKEKLTPYCLISFNNVHFRTNVLNPTLRPEWKQRFTYNEKDLQSDTAELLISVWDSDKYNTDTFLGQISMPILNVKANEVCKQWCALTTKEGQETKGKLLIEFNLITSDGVLQKRFSSKTKFNAVNGDKPHIEIINITPEMQAKEAELSPRSSRTDIDKPNTALRSSVNMRDLDSSDSPRAVTRTDSNVSGPGSGATPSKRRGSATNDASPEHKNATNKTNKTEDLNTSRENNGPESADVASSNNHTNKTDKSASDHLQESSSSDSNKKELINMQGDPYKQPETATTAESKDKPNETPTKRKSSSKLGFLKISMKKKASSTPVTPETKKKHSNNWMKKFSRKLTPSKKGNKTDDESDWSKDFSDIAERTPFVTKYPALASQLPKVELDRQEAISALLLSVQRLSQDLQFILQEYYTPMKKNGLITKELKQVFAEVDDLASGTRHIADVLEERQSSSPIIEKAADAFNKRDSLWTKYASYLTNYDKIVKRVENARADSDKANLFLTTRARDLAPLETLLARPVQHLLDLELLLDELDSATASSHPDSKYVGEMVKIVHNCLENMNSDRLLHFSKLRELQRQLYFTQKVKKFSLWANAERNLMFEGSGSVHPLRKPGTRNEIFLLVFSDMLLITRPKRVSTKKLTLNNKVSRHLLVTRRVFLNEMFLHDPSLDLREQIPDVIEIVSPNIGVWRLGMGGETERVTKIIESQLARVGLTISDSDKSTEYNRLVELAKSRKPQRSKSRASASQLSPRSPRSPRKSVLSTERSNSNTTNEQLMGELEKARDAVRELAMKASIAEQERDEYRRRMEEETRERIKLERVISTQQEQISSLKAAQSKPAKETVEVQTLLDMLKHETEARREVEEHNRDLRNNYLKLTALVTEKQLQESQLMGRVLSLEHELARKDESSHIHRDVIRERQNIEDLLERGKKDLMKRLAESKQAIQREFNQLIEVATGYANTRGNMSDDDMEVSPRVMSFAVPQNGYKNNKSPGVSPRVDSKANGMVPSGSAASMGYTSSDNETNKREVGRLNLNNSTRTLNPPGAKSPVGTPTGAKSPKSKKVKTYNYSSDNAEENKEGWKAKLRLSTKKKKDVQATPWRTPPTTAAQNQPFVLQFKANKVDWNTVKNEQSYWSDDFNESDYSSGVITGSRAAPNGGENYDDLDNSVSVDDQQ